MSSSQPNLAPDDAYGKHLLLVSCIRRFFPKPSHMSSHQILSSNGIDFSNLRQANNEKETVTKTEEKQNKRKMESMLKKEMKYVTRSRENKVKNDIKAVPWRFKNVEINRQMFHTASRDNINEIYSPKQQTLNLSKNQSHRSGKARFVKTHSSFSKRPTSSSTYQTKTTKRTKLTRPQSAIILNAPKNVASPRNGQQTLYDLKQVYRSPRRRGEVEVKGKNLSPKNLVESKVRLGGMKKGKGKRKLKVKKKAEIYTESVKDIGNEAMEKYKKKVLVNRNPGITPEQIVQNAQDHESFLARLEKLALKAHKQQEIKDLIFEGTKSTIVDYDEYKTKILSILNQQDVDEEIMEDLYYLEKMWDRQKQHMDKNYEEFKNKGMKGDDYLRNMVTEKETLKQRQEEYQNQKFMKKFCLLSDLNCCIASDFKDPDIVIPVKPRELI